MPPLALLTRRRHLMAAAATAVTMSAGLAFGTSPAVADPKGSPVTLTCDNGSTYSATLSGNGEFTPAHDLAGTSMVVPTSFGVSTFVLRDASGAIIDSETSPPVSKGSSEKDRATSVHCSYVFQATFEIPELGQVTATGSGTVTGFVTPVR